MVRRRDEHDLDVLHVEHLPVVGEALGVGGPLLHQVDLIGVNVARGQDVDRCVPQEAVQVAAATVAGPDDAEADPIVRPENTRVGKGCHGRGTAAGLAQELPTINFGY